MLGWCLAPPQHVCNIFVFLRDGQQVLAYGEKALAMARELGLKELEGYVLSNLSWAYALSSQLKEVCQANNRALEIWQALGNLPMAADVTSILAELEEMNDNQSEAEKLRCQAQEIIGYIADQAGSQELRETFLAQPAVAQVLSEIY